MILARPEGPVYGVNYVKAEAKTHISPVRAEVKTTRPKRPKIQWNELLGRLGRVFPTSIVVTRGFHPFVIARDRHPGGVAARIVPKGHLRIAQRFNVGTRFRRGVWSRRDG